MLEVSQGHAGTFLRLHSGKLPARRIVCRRHRGPCRPDHRTQSQVGARVHQDLRSRSPGPLRGIRISHRGARPRAGHKALAPRMEVRADREGQSGLVRPCRGDLGLCTFPGRSAARSSCGVMRCRPGIVRNSELGAIAAFERPLVGTIPDLRSTAPQELRAAPRPGKVQRPRLVPLTCAQCCPGSKSWLGKAEASGVLMTTKFCSAVAWQALQPAVIWSKVLANWRVSPALMTRSMAAKGCLSAASTSSETGSAFQRGITLVIVPKP